MTLKILKTSRTARAVAASFILASGWSTSRAADVTPGANQELTGSVQADGKPIAGATVTLYAAGIDAPDKLAEGKTDDQGLFKLVAGHAPRDSVFYVVAKGGTPKAAASKGANDAIALLALLGSPPRNSVTINEFTTVASAFTAARFIQGESISGNPLGLRIAAGNVPNFVDLETGGWGKVLSDPINSSQGTTLANFNTLSSLLSAFIIVADDSWRASFFKAATPPGGATPNNILEAMAGIARTPWAHPSELFALFDQAYPKQKDGLRDAPFLPYQRFAPSDFVLSLWFGGGGMFSAGDMAFDAEGNLWSGCNWMPGAQNWVFDNIGGGTAKFSPNGTALSPAITGFRGMETTAGIGWGTAVTLENVWVSSFNGAIGVLDFRGNPIAKESDIPFAGKVHDLMGIGVAANGDVWIAATAQNELLYFPGGRIKEGRIVKVAGLKAPFGIAIDAQNRVWVSNSQSDSVVRFPAEDPSKVESFTVGVSPRGVALDSEGNLWVVSTYSFGSPPFNVPQGASIMEQFKFIAEYARKNFPSGNYGGTASMIRPDGTQPEPKGFDGNRTINGGWGIAVDGDDNVWIGNAVGMGVVLLAGDDPKGRPPGTKTGDLIHCFQSGTIPLVTAAVPDPAGNVWVASNWNDVHVVESDSRVSRTSTWGGGNGVTVLYGVAGPVKTPLMGQVRTF